MVSSSTPYAHSSGSDPSGWQPLDDHLRQVAELAARFAAPFDSATWAANAAWLHDIGKADSSFQGYLLMENGLDASDYDSGRTNHSSAGAAFAIETLGPAAGRILAYLSAGHHAGLPDWDSAETGNGALSIRLVEGRENLERIRAYAANVAQALKPARPPEFARKPEHVHLWMRMLYSCLVDADFLDTEAFMDRQKSILRTHTPFSSIAELQALFNAHMAKKAATAPATPVNAIRQEILAACRSAAQSSPGLFSLTVPTGGGKTLSSMAFALDHAVKHGKDRIIYVIPYTSIIEQTAKILRDIFGDDNVVEHHSNLDPDREPLRSQMAAENWDAPIIVTTNVQFFESLYAAKSSRCRKLHNLVNSVVILDEAQLLPPALLAPCVNVMTQLAGNYGVSLVLATATQPALPGIGEVREIIPAGLNLYARLKRTEFHFPVDVNAPGDWRTIAAQLEAHEQVLCIVNTRRDCYDLFKLMPKDTVHLSALMCGEHRSEVIAQIKEKLKAGVPVRVVSTQLVEAGVDIDFPVVYRALTGLDSIAQAAGRCNREGRMAGMGQVQVFIPPKPSPRGLQLKAENTTRELLSLEDFDPANSGEYTRYFKSFYDKGVDESHGGKKFDVWLVRDVNPQFILQFRTAAANFKFIDDQAQQPVFVRYRNSAKLLDTLRRIGPTRDNLRRLQRYTVTLSVRAFEQAKVDGLLEEVFKDYWAWTGAYDQTFGLDLFGAGRAPEDLMV